MSISVYGYIREERDGHTMWNFPSTMRDRLESESIPAIGTPAYLAWYEGDLSIPNPLHDPRLDVNMSNRNAEFVLNELGFLNGDVHDSEPLPIDVFETGLRATMARNLDLIPGIEAADYGGDSSVRVIDPGVPDGYANHRFAQLLELVAAAREYGATHIGWA